MERTEPALVPQWLKCAGNVHGGGTPVHHSDVPSSVHSARSRYVRSNSEKDNSRFLGRNHSSNSRLGSISNLSAEHPYRSFTRSHHDRNCDSKKDKSFSEDKWDQNSYVPLSSILTMRNERNALPHSQSMVSRKPGEVLHHRIQDSKNGIDSQSTTSGAISGANVDGRTKNHAFEKDFPSLGAEEKRGVSGIGGIGRIISPRSSSSLKSLPIGNTGFLGGEKWTSALAEVPCSLANNGIGHPPLQQSSAENLSSESDVINAVGRNMAEALSQPAERTSVAAQLPDKSQRLEELAIKQSRQLIPTIPSMPKSLTKVPGSLDKAKQPKFANRTHPSNQSRAGKIRTDSSIAPHVSKFLVLKPGRENNPTPAIKDASNSTGDSQVANAQISVAPPIPTASLRLKKYVVSGIDNKTATLSLRSRSKVELRSSQSLARSRSEFFNLMRKKSTSITNGELISAISSPSDETSKESDTPVSSLAMENGSEMILNGNFSDHGAICPDEEEAAFLRSLGWDENEGEDEGLTEDEIKAFYEEYMSRRPSSKLVSSLNQSS